jgi:uncharacterized protein YhhL (DUF1145 family)
VNQTLYKSAQIIILLFYVANIAVFFVPYPVQIAWLFPLTGVAVIIIHTVQLLVYRALLRRRGTSISSDAVVGILLYGMLYIRGRAA